MHRLIIFSMILFLFGCAHTTKKDQIKDEVQNGNISVVAVKNLAYSSYLKACTQVSKLSFEACKKLAIKHSEEIEEIIK